MSQIVERSSLDLRYEGHRLRDGAREARLLASIAERGIEQPLEGVDTPAGRFLLNGFQRACCAQKLGIDSVPYRSLGEDEALGILSLMRAATDKALSQLEQARFIGELLTVHGLSLPEIAEKLSRSKGWVSMRKQLLEAMSPAIQELLFRGAFPVYGYMYTLRPFRRMNGVSQEVIERFMRAVAGPRRSVREIELLAQGYFLGPASLREAIEAGKLSWSLEQMKSVPEDREGCNEFERRLLGDLGSLQRLLQRLLQRVMLKCEDPRLQSRAFFAQAIDAISYYQMHPNALCLSTSGVRVNPLWLSGLLIRGYEIHCGFDADEPGDAVAAQMIALHPAVQRLRPSAHDWNDVLTSRR